LHHTRPALMPRCLEVTNWSPCTFLFAVCTVVPRGSFLGVSFALPTQPLVNDFLRDAGERLAMRLACSRLPTHAAAALTATLMASAVSAVNSSNRHAPTCYSCPPPAATICGVQSGTAPPAGPASTTRWLNNPNLRARCCCWCSNPANQDKCSYGQASVSQTPNEQFVAYQAACSARSPAPPAPPAPPPVTNPNNPGEYAASGWWDAGSTARHSRAHHPGPGPSTATADPTSDHCCQLCDVPALLCSWQ
jgi:hypothetical protein